MNEIEAAESALRIARNAHQSIKSTLDAEVSRARDDIHAAYADRLSAASVKIADCERALRDAQDKLPAHEWEGQRVFRLESKSRWVNEKTRVDGVVETVRSTSPFAANIAFWRQPSIGTVIVRLLKKDGSGSLKFESLSDYRGVRWQLAEQVPA